jgi:nitroreductase
MDITEAVERRLEVREYADDPVPEAVKRAVVEAARLAPSSKNRQNWHFLLADGEELGALAAASPSGAWVEDAAFAVVVLTEDYPSHGVDVGRAVSQMQFAAWDHGVGSCIYTGVDEGALRDRFGVPDRFVDGAVVGFGYPADSGTGTKRRRPVAEVASRNRFGDPL